MFKGIAIALLGGVLALLGGLVVASAGNYYQAGEWVQLVGGLAMAVGGGIGFIWGGFLVVDKATDISADREKRRDLAGEIDSLKYDVRMLEVSRNRDHEARSGVATAKAAGEVLAARIEQIERDHKIDYDNIYKLSQRLNTKLDKPWSAVGFTNTTDPWNFDGKL
jgi:hypothetical protein